LLLQGSNGFFNQRFLKRILNPERSVRVSKFHHIKEYVLDDSIVKSSALIIICYMFLFAVCTALGVYYGYPFADSAFEAASVTGNVGLSIGVTSISMPSLMKVQYILTMYLGRLEFISVFALLGYIVEGVKKLCAHLSKRS